MKIALIIAALIGLCLGSGLTVAVERATRAKPTVVNVPPCPACNCPPSVSLQNFDLDKLNNRKGNFTYSPQLSNVTVKIENKDSALVKAILRGGN